MEVYVHIVFTPLEKSVTVCIHHRNIQALAIEIFKSLNDSSPSLMSELFKVKETKYDLRTGNQLKSNCTSHDKLWNRYCLIFGFQNLESGSY